MRLRPGELLELVVLLAIIGGFGLVAFAVTAVLMWLGIVPAPCQ